MSLFIQTAYAATTATEKGQEGILAFFSGFFTVLPLWIMAGIVFALSFVVAGVIEKIVVHHITTRSKQNLHQEVILLVERAVYFGVVLLGAIIALGIVGIEVAALFGFMGLGLGFALKDLLGNVIAGVVILTQKKFKIGDVIKVDERFGTIEEISVRTTVIQAFDGTELIIPNAKMVTEVVQNLTANSLRRITVPVSVHYSTDLDKAIEAAKATVRAHKDVVPEPSVDVIATEFGPSSITLEIRFWFESHKNWFRIRSEVIQEIKDAFKKNDITIPYPIQTVALDKYDQDLHKAFHIPLQLEVKEDVSASRPAQEGK